MSSSASSERSRGDSSDSSDSEERRRRAESSDSDNHHDVVITSDRDTGPEDFVDDLDVDDEQGVREPAPFRQAVVNSAALAAWASAQTSHNYPMVGGGHHHQQSLGGSFNSADEDERARSPDALSYSQASDPRDDWDFVNVVLNDLEMEAEPYFIARQDLAQQLIALRRTEEEQRARLANWASGRNTIDVANNSSSGPSSASASATGVLMQRNVLTNSGAHDMGPPARNFSGNPGDIVDGDASRLAPADLQIPQKSPGVLHKTLSSPNIGAPASSRVNSAESTLAALLRRFGTTLQKFRGAATGVRQVPTALPKIEEPDGEPKPDSEVRFSSATTTTESSPERATIGIVCMDKKGRSKPMQEILSRIVALEPVFDIKIFGEAMLFQKEPADWPHVDIVITFFSGGFPMERMLEYRRLHPDIFYVNDPTSEFLLRDRGLVYERLVMNHIPTARHIVVRRDAADNGPTVISSQNYIEVDGITLKKPFVEKPISGEDHAVIVYHHSNAGGGSTALFRKTDDNRCSTRSTDDSIRTQGSFIYEEFIDTDDVHDVKVYAVGVHYAYAECRRSPVAGENVLRRADGREVRHVTELSREEREIAYKIVKSFNMNVCGFDILRRGNKSYVCDVNGWSFVKGNADYYDNCANFLVDMFRRAIIMRGLTPLVPGPFVRRKREALGGGSIQGRRVLRGMVGVFRHGDRTPKQKVKIKASNKRFCEFFAMHAKSHSKEVKMKNTTNFEDLQILRKIIEEELQLPPENFDGFTASDADKLYLFRVVIARNYGGLKVQLKPKRLNSENLCCEMLIVCKWGGILTHAGELQSVQVGEDMRRIVKMIAPPGSETQYGDSIPKSSLQVMSNNERRVKQTGLIVAQTILRGQEFRESEIIDNALSHALLDDVSAADSLIEIQKEELNAIMHLDDAAERPDLPTLRALVKKPLYTMQSVHKLMKELKIISPSLSLCGGEPVHILLERWRKLRTDFYDPTTHRFDTSKIPDLFDYCNYDTLHNQRALRFDPQAKQFGFDMYNLFDKAERMARFLVPKEYGVRAKDKLVIGSIVSGPLFDHICSDVSEIKDLVLDFDSDTPTPSVPTTRLYFTSESHMHTLRNILLHSGVAQMHNLIEPVELNYLTHVLFLVWEDIVESAEDEESLDERSVGGSSETLAGDIEDSKARVFRSSTHIPIPNPNQSQPVPRKGHDRHRSHGSLPDPDLIVRLTPSHEELLRSLDVPRHNSLANHAQLSRDSGASGASLVPGNLPRTSRVFLEIRFSVGASKNPWGIAEQHCATIGQAATLQDYLTLRDLERMQRIVSGVRSSAGKSDAN